MVFEAALPLLNDFARIPVCGLIAQYNLTSPMPGPDMFTVLRKRLLLRGFIVCLGYGVALKLILT